MTSVDFSKKCIIFITGASRGIGRSIAVELSRNVNQNSIFILIAKSGAALDETKHLINEVDKSLNVHNFVLDLSKPDSKDYEKIFSDVEAQIDTKGIEFGLFFHNAGTIGVLSQTTDLIDLEIWRQYFDLNMFSTSLLNSAFIKKIRPIAPQLVVVNISSICGRTPFLNMAMYGAVKAARELFFKVVAIEEPKIIVLNYSPGPINTDMFEDVLKNAQSEELRNNFSKVKETRILTPTETSEKLLGVLEKGDFKSGDVIDYYDIK